MGDEPLASRPGIEIIDWNVSHHPQGTPGNEIATLFSLVVGDREDDSAARFVVANMDAGGPPRLRHSHTGWTSTIVLSGSVDIEGVTFNAGQLVLVAPHVVYGPIVPGPDGASVLEIFTDGAAIGSFWDAPEPQVADYRERGWIG